MDDDIKIKDLKNQIKKFCDDRDWDQFHNAKELSIGVITEAAELLEHFRFKSEKEMKEMLENPKKREEISEEMADILFFLLRLAQFYDIDISDALTRKIEKNEKKYPVEKSKSSNKKYTEF